jgi:fatty acid-binding protein DegV
MRIAIVTDSIADLPADVASETGFSWFPSM